MTTVTINPGDGQGDDAAYINAILADPNVTHVILGAGTFELKSSLNVPSNTKLSGQGREVTILQAQQGFIRDEFENDAVVNSEYGAVNVKLSDFTVDANKLRPDDYRLLGTFMREAEDFEITGVDVKNATGYAHHAYGANNGIYEDCYTYNSNVHFEQMFSHNITIINSHARDGDGDILAESHFHPLVGSTNITYIDCSSISAASGGWSIVPLSREISNITIINCYAEVVTSPALVGFSTHPITNLQIIGSTFISHENVAARMGSVSGTAENSYFQGAIIGMMFGSGGNGSPNAFVATNSTVIGLGDPLNNQVGYGLVNTNGSLMWDGGVIAAHGLVGYPFGSADITAIGGARLISGFDAISLFIEDTVVISPAAQAGLPADAFGSFNGGSLTASLLGQLQDGDVLGLMSQGNGPDQIGIAGSQISYGGVVIGVISTGEGLLRIDFGAAATAAAVLAVSRAITFASESDTPATTLRLLDLVFKDSATEVGNLTVAIGVQPVNDAPNIDLDGAGGSLVAAYTEQADAIAIAPEAEIADPDSPTLAGGSLTVSFSGGGEPADSLTILNAGNGPGQISVVGSAIFFEGRLIGTASGGANGAPLTVGLLSAAIPAAVQALARSIAYSNSSDKPAPTKLVGFALNDGDGGTTSVEATIQVTSVDDPGVAVDDAAQTTESAAVRVDVLANDSDPDSTPAIARIDGTNVAAGETVTIQSGAFVTLNADGTLLYDPKGSFDHLGAGILGQDSFTYSLVGGGTATVNVTLEGSNRAPVVDLNGGLAGTGMILNYREGQGVALLAPGAAVSDIDNPVLNGGTLTVALTAGGTSSDRLVLIDQGSGPFQVGVIGGNVTWAGQVVGTSTGGENGEPLVITFNGLATTYVVTMVTRRVAFENVSQDPSPVPRTVSFTLTDGEGGISVPAVSRVPVAVVNNPGVAADDVAQSTAGGTVTIDVLANDFDPDSALAIAGIDGAIVTAGQTVLVASGARVTLNADGTLRYDPNGKFDHLNGGATGQDSFTYSLAGGNTATVNITLTGNSTPPVIDLNGGLAGTGMTLNYREGQGVAALAPGASVSDVDSPVLNGGTLTVAFIVGGTASDRLTLIDQGSGPFQVGLSGGNVTWAGQVVGTIAGGENGEPLVITFNALATSYIATMVARRVAFENVSDDPSTTPRTVSFTLTDGEGGVSSPAISTVNVAAVANSGMAMKGAASIGGVEQGKNADPASFSDDPSSSVGEGLDLLGAGILTLYLGDFSPIPAHGRDEPDSLSLAASAGDGIDLLIGGGWLASNAASHFVSTLLPLSHDPLDTAYVSMGTTDLSV